MCEAAAAAAGRSKVPRWRRRAQIAPYSALLRCPKPLERAPAAVPRGVAPSPALGRLHDSCWGLHRAMEAPHEEAAAAEEQHVKQPVQFPAEEPQHETTRLDEERAKHRAR